MKLTVRSPIVYVAAAAALVALLVIARPALNPAANPTEQSSNASVATGPLPDVPVIDLDLDRLRVAGRELGEAERDPFRFRPKAPPPAPRVQAPPPVFAPAAPAGPPPVPAIPLQLIGFIGGDQPVAAFRDAHGNTFRGKEGDVLEGRYRLLRVGPNSVDVANLDGSGRQTIRMTGQ
jgi:hypothetical protein